MNEKDGGPAFPCSDVDSCGNERQRFTGMALRDYFAAKVIQGMSAADDGRCPNQEDKKDIDAWRSKCMMQDAETAYLQADAMIKAREKGGA